MKKTTVRYAVAAGIALASFTTTPALAQTLKSEVQKMGRVIKERGMRAN